jgi:hypothetical protein
VLGSLVQWVEKGVASNFLADKISPANGTVIQRKFCFYPQDLIYVGGDHKRWLLLSGVFEPNTVTVLG